MEPNALPAPEECFPTSLTCTNDNDCLKSNVTNTDHYIEWLMSHQNSLTKTLSQIRSSAKTQEKEVKDRFQSIAAVLMKTLDKRKNELLQEIGRHLNDAVLPIITYQDEIEGKLQSARDFLDNGNDVLRPESGQPENSNLLDQDFFKKASISEPSLLAESCLNVSLHFNETLIRQALEDISKFGQVFDMSAIQIVDIEERPGALAIRWEEKEYESEVEGNFKLQYCMGDVCTNKTLMENFTDVYIGSETSHIVRNLSPKTEYSFRVCRHCDPLMYWSFTLVAQTSLLPYAWSSSNTSYSLSNDDKIATKIATGSAVLFSSSPQFKYKHSTQFRILQCGNSLENDGLGLWLPTAQLEITNPCQAGVVLVSVKGYIYVNGVRMTTRLPEFSEGSVITFDSDGQIITNKMRITITHEEKQVTYDWTLDGGSCLDNINATKADSAYLFVALNDIGWSIEVR